MRRGKDEKFVRIMNKKNVLFDSYSTSTDKVFVYFSDHGGVGLIGFPGDIVRKLA